MIFPMFYMDEDNYEDYNTSLREIQEAVDKERIFVGSGEDCFATLYPEAIQSDAPSAWEKSNGQNNCQAW